MNDQLPPHNLDDERGVLACVLQDAELCLPDCAKLREDSFFEVLHQIAWRAISALARANAVVNSISVSRILQNDDKIEGAFGKISEIESQSPSAHNLSNYLPSVFDLAMRRRMMRGCAAVQSQAMSGGSAEMMSSAEALLSWESPNAAPILDGEQSAQRMIDDLERRHALNGALPGLDTGLHDLNRQIDGLQYGEQTLIGARPSIGKTAIGLTIFEHAVFVLKTPALFVSLEMSAAALMRRSLSSQMKIGMSTVRQGTYDEGIFHKIMSFRLASAKAPLYILDGAGGLTISEVCMSVRRHVRKNKIKLVVVDYLQKIRPAERHEKRTYEVADVSGKLRALAVETGAAFLTLAQLNRDSEKDKPRMPRLSDLADSGQIERDADTIILLDRNREESVGSANLIVAKQRDGETGLVKLKFNGPYCRFENLSPISQDDVPSHHNS